MTWGTINRYVGQQSDFPICCKALQEPGSMDPFKADHFRLLYLPSGSGLITINDVAMPFFGPAVVCLNDGENCQLPDIPPESWFLGFNPIFLNSSLGYDELRKPLAQASAGVRENRLLLWPFINRTSGYSGLLNLGADSAVSVKKLLYAICDEIHQQPSGWWPCRTRAFMSELFFMLGHTLTAAHSDTAPVYLDERPKELAALHYLCRHYNRKMSVAQIAGALGTNRTTLNQQIRALTGLPVNQYLIDLRLRHAAILLADTDFPVHEIADRVGFDDLSNFERRFKHRYQATPRDYRRAYNERFRDTAAKQG